MKAVNLKAKLALFDTHWDPKIVGELNGQHVKLAKLLSVVEWSGRTENRKDSTGMETRRMPSRKVTQVFSLAVLAPDREQELSQ